MINISEPSFDKCRFWIRDARNVKKGWNHLKYALQDSEENLMKFLENQKETNFWPTDINVESWYKLVESEKEGEERSDEIEMIEKKAVLIDESQDSDVIVPMDRNSSWQLYKNHLLDSGFKHEAVEEIEKATIGLLKRLNRDTSGTNSIKGLVIGHVQSGKTANMAALMAMAADWGWNFFVVLSGTIENLRKQTQSRLFRDLNLPGNVYWQGLEHLSKRCPMGSRLQELRLEDGAQNRYFTVSLKNSGRLKKLNEWMHTDKNKLKQIKMIIIDDEADQASINTADITVNERTKINKLIVNLVEGRNPDGTETEVKAGGINYISYTATPYANFLNESSPESLYPRNFIRALKPSNEYFGPKQIFGIEETDDCDGMNILRVINATDLEVIKSLHNSEVDFLPLSLKESICWFLCGAATMRYWGYKKPISMLVHTSQKQAHHEEVAEGIKRWLLQVDEMELIAMCEATWDDEVNEMSMESFRESFEEYGRSDEEINDYPKFEKIVGDIKILIENITHIPLGDEGDFEYKSHIHLCVDNCSKNGINDEGMYVRLAYPEPNMNPYPTPAPTFIIVGGSTLSRGLTIEGLISTYFLRSTCQADSLMQMGRWFGYRRGYELIPRIWMTQDTISKFRFLSALEAELRDDLNKYMLLGASPLDYGPRVKNSPRVSWMRITGKKRMQSAQEVDVDYTGTSTQTILFENDIKILSSNISITEEFIYKLGEGKVSDLKSSYIWKNIKFERILEDFLSEFIFHSRSRVFNEIEIFSEWVKEITERGDLKDWNIIVAGNGNVGIDSKENDWKIGEYSIGKVNRSRKILKKSDDETINIGVLRTPKDLLADVEFAKLSSSSIELLKNPIKSEVIDEIRKEAEVEDNPQLIIYRIDKDSEARSKSKKDGLRKDLNSIEDIIGLCITLPGIRRNRMAQSLTIRLSQKKPNDEWGEE